MADSRFAPIDWTRMAEPQADGYDTDVTMHLAESEVGSRRTVASQPDASVGRRTICNGSVAIRLAPKLGLVSDAILPAELDHPNLELGAALLGRWSLAYRQFGQLINTVYPYTDPAQCRLGKWALGSSSHSYDEEFGSVHCTIDDGLGLAQALVQEMAHHKLRALGVSFETAHRLVINDPSV